LALGPNWQGKGNDGPRGEVWTLRPGKPFGVFITAWAEALAKNRATSAMLGFENAMILVVCKMKGRG
jgi:hypothetical protein